MQPQVTVLNDKLTALLKVLKAAKLPNGQQLVLVASLIDELTDAERVTLRKAAELHGMKLLPRNLYYNYATQTWID